MKGDSRRPDDHPVDHPLADPVTDQLARLDDVKRMIAVSVNHALVTGPLRLPLMGLPADAHEVTGRAVSALVTEVTVDTDFGPRVFLVKVSESNPPRRRTDEET